ncbi:MAG: DJ-1/PfpI family protein [Acidobacteria bacterium]|nr:DJ-1/PfpI family protein [Acidobacteriota bacterium]
MILTVLFSFFLASEPHTIGIIVFDDVLTSEITAPAEVFGMAIKEPELKGWQVQLISVNDHLTVRTAEGLKIQADLLLSQAGNVDVLIVPGAYETEDLRKHAALIAFIQKQPGWIASNCSGAFILGQSGVLDGRRATTWPGGEPDLQRLFPKVQVQSQVSLVVDGQRLTTNGGLVSYEGAFVLLAHLSNRKVTQKVFEMLNGQRRLSWEELVKFLP